MKKHQILILGLGVLPMLLVACSPNNPSSSTTSSQNEQNNVVNTNLKNMKLGFKMNGVITQERVQAGIDSNGNIVPMPGVASETNIYNSDFVYESNQETGFQRIVYQNVMDEVVYIENLIVFADEDNQVYRQSLNYENKIEKVYSNVSAGMSKTSFDANGYYNWASLLNESDIVYDKQNNQYNLDVDKASFIVSLVLSYLNSGFYSVPRLAYFTSDENGIFNSFYVEMATRLMWDSPDGVYNYLYIVENKAEFTLSDLGTAQVERISTLPNKPENANLESALKTITGNNFTIKITDTKQSLDGLSETSTYQKMYFDGANIYVANWSDEESDTSETTRNPNDYLLKPDAASEKLFSYVYNNGEYRKATTTQFSSVYQGMYYYEDLLPIVNNVSKDLFVYNNTTNNYENEAIALQALTGCFNIAKPPFKSSHITNASSVAIRLNNDGSLAYVQFSYNYMSLSDIERGMVKIEFLNVGETEIPFND